MINTIAYRIRQQVKGFSARVAEFGRDTAGAVMIIAGFGIMLILIGIFALSLDHGRNYEKQSDLDAKLNIYATHLSNEFKEFKIGQFVVMGAAAAVPPQAPNLQQHSAPEYYLTETALQITEDQAITKLETRLKQLIQQNPDLGNVGAVKIAQACEGDALVMRYSARIAQHDDFKPTAGDESCMSTDSSGGYLTPQQGCTLTKAAVKLPIGCEPPVPTPGTGASPPEGPCGIPCDDPSECRFPTVSTAVTSISNGSAIVEFVLSLDMETKNSIIAGSSLSTLIRNAVYYADIPDDELAAGLTIGNRPIIGGGINCLARNPDMGFSGSCYDNASRFDGTSYSTMGLPNQNRKYKLEGEFYSQPTRTCSTNPSWTYEDARDPDIGANNCTYNRSGVADASSCPSYNGCEIMSYDSVGQVCSYSCEIKQPDFRAACLIDNQQYRYADELLNNDNIKAYYSKTLQGADKSSFVGAPVLVGRVIRAPLNTADEITSGGQVSDQPQDDDISGLMAYNTARSWNWAEREYGKSLVINNQTDAINAGLLDRDAEMFTLQLSPASCTDPTCSFPEGYYRMEITEPVLNGQQITATAKPDPNLNTQPPEVDLVANPSDPRRYWAFPGNVDAGFSGGTCPGEPNPSSTGGGYSYAYAVRLTDPQYEAIRTGTTGSPLDRKNVVPPERLNISSITMERRRVGGDPFTCSVDEFDDPNSNLYPAHTANVMAHAVADRQAGLGPTTGVNYPWFTEYVVPGTDWASATPTGNTGSLIEHGFWDTPVTDGVASATGILSMAGGGGAPTTHVIGAVSTNPRYEALFDGEDDPAFDPFDPALSVGPNPRKTLIQAQALDMVRRMDSDYPFTNKDIIQGGVFQALPDLGASYSRVDIHGGHATNQCALAKAALRKLKAAGDGDNPRTMVFVGACPTEDRRNFSTNNAPNTPVNWFAYGNGTGVNPGTVNSSNLTLSVMDRSGYNSLATVRTETEACFQDIADELSAEGGNLFIVTRGDQCETFANKSTGGVNCARGCVLNHTDPDRPNRTSQDCVRAMLGCITGGTVTVPEP